MAELFIDGEWREGRGKPLTSTDPSSRQLVWQGNAADESDCRDAVAAAHRAFEGWSTTPLPQRIAFARTFAEILKRDTTSLAIDISRETGKPLWETKAEVGSMIGKVELSIRAQVERAGERRSDAAFGQAVLRHRPHGVMAVLGPYNFPGHLPNGHIVPALLAGDTIVFKPSEETPLAGRRMALAWEEAGLPRGVFNLIQGDRDAGAALLSQPIHGLLFTGSAAAGAYFRRRFIDRPEVILALELGGNNPLIVWDGEPHAAASIIVQSSFITTGQRCSCARRLIVPEGDYGTAVVQAVDRLTDRLTIGSWDDPKEAFMGPLISEAAADRAVTQYQHLLDRGARSLRPFQQNGNRSRAFVSPGIIDVTGVEVPDEEIFAPLLQVRRVASFDDAVREANATAFGLSAGLISGDDALWHHYVDRAHAGVVNRNRPTTGASGAMPFGGLGASGNHRPSAYYAADYCAYPIASFEAPGVSDLSHEIKGLESA
jgi:succinylglutamic semialdehyde dehydrogenase